MKLTCIETHLSFGGHQRKYRHFSETLNCEMVFSLFLPQDDPAKKTALVWWLSGLTCTDDNFSQKGAFQEYANRNQIAIAIPDTSPRGETVHDHNSWDLGQGASFYLNATQSPWKENYQMYDYITKELTDLIHPLIPNFSGAESIMGHSMGGHGALVIGLKNPQRFRSISAFAPISNPINVPWGKKAFTAYLGENKGIWKDWDAAELIQALDTAPPIYITQGTADEFYGEQLDASLFLKNAADHEVNYQKVLGYDHSYFTISTFIGAHLAFHQAYLGEE